MKADIEDAAALSAVSPAALRAYAEAEGWVQLEPFGAHSHVYLNKSLGAELIIPATSALGDYAATVSELIDRFARAEDRDQLQVFRDLSVADRDVIRVRSPEADDVGSVRIEAGVELFIHARELVLSAACSAWSPRASYRAGRVRQADDYMDRVRLGQTEHGSFVVTMLAPVPPQLDRPRDLWPNEADEPYERRVTRTLAGGLDAAADSVEKHLGGAGFAVFQNAVGRGVSSNLCEATAGLIPQGDGLEVSVTWARTRPAAVARWSRTFTRSEGEVLREVARVIQERQSRPDEQIEGLIVKLTRDGEAFDGRVTMKAVVDGRLRSVQAELQPSDYEVAIEAHRQRRPISALGTLEPVGHRWRLAGPTGVQLVPEEADDDEVPANI